LDRSVLLAAVPKPKDQLSKKGRSF